MPLHYSFRCDAVSTWPCDAGPYYLYFWLYEPLLGKSNFLWNLVCVVDDSNWSIQPLVFKWGARWKEDQSGHGLLHFLCCPFPDGWNIFYVITVVYVVTIWKSYFYLIVPGVRKIYIWIILLNSENPLKNTPGATIAVHSSYENYTTSLRKEILMGNYFGGW